MKRLELLDYGRMLAASGVVSFHYLYNGIRNGKIASLTNVTELVAFAQYGYLGVNFFFIISGYVIFFSAQNRSAAGFAVSRATRLFPAFWIAVLLTSACAAIWGGPLMSVTPAEVAANLTMMAPDLRYGYVDGVYWTLRLELSFYGLVLLLLLLGLQDRLATLALLWPAVMLIAHVAGLAHLPFAGGYYVFFAAGMVLAIVKGHLTLPSSLSLGICVYLCVHAATDEAARMVTDGMGISVPLVGLIILAMFAFFFALNSPRGSSVVLPGSRMAGALTYPVYLVHAHIGYMLLSRFGRDEFRMWSYLATLAVVFLLSYLIHRYWEQRFAAQWHGLFYRVLYRPLSWAQQKAMPIGALARRLIPKPRTRPGS
jgi:peptidoglycan/LPS O-acetylase OafA/YrhL